MPVRSLPVSHTWLRAAVSEESHLPSRKGDAPPSQLLLRADGPAGELRVQHVEDEDEPRVLGLEEHLRDP